MSGWPSRELGDVGVSVLDCEHKTPPALENGHPYIAIPDLRDGRINFSSARKISDDALVEWTRRTKPQRGDIVVTRRGRVGDTAPIPSDIDCAIGQNLVILRSDETQVDQGYLRWACQGQLWAQEVDRLMNVGAVFSSLNVRDISRLRITVPPLPEQRAIAATLGALDDKIESNVRAIELCEALGASILEDELGLDVYGYPHYGEATLGDRLSLLETGSRPRGGVQAGGRGVPSLGAENIQSAGTVIAKQFKMVPDDFAGRMRRGRLADGDVLVYKDGGTPGNFTPHVSAFGEGFPAETATINEHVYRVRATGALSQATLYWLLRSPWMDAEMRKRGTGVAIPGLNQSNFRSLPFPNVGDAGLLRLSERLDPLFRVMLQVGKESQRLGALRDALLPELLSGRIKGPAAEAA